MTSRVTPASGSQALTWTADGKLASVTGAKGTTGYVYDADGNLLLQEDPGSTTLYLPGEQLTATASGSTTTVAGARIIALPSGGEVVRTGAATSYSFEIADQQGTNDLELDDTAQLPTWGQFTPYGAPRGTTVTWADNRGFLNKAADAATGLTYVGARAYDPGTAQFISADPVLKPSDPQDLNPYDYAEDNPVTSSDPTGQAAIPTDGSGTEHPQPYHAPTGPPCGLACGSSSGSGGGYKSSGDPGMVAKYPGLAYLSALSETMQQRYMSMMQHGLYMYGGHSQLNVLDSLYGFCDSEHVDDSVCGQKMASVLFGEYMGLAGQTAAVAGIGEFGPAAAEAFSTGEAGIAADGMTFTDAESVTAGKDLASLYRGVHADHPALAEAKAGNVEPIGGHSDPALHNGGNNRSIFTSWTTDPGIAYDVASEYGPGGVVLRVPAPSVAGRTVESPDIYDESEVLITGKVTGASVVDAFEFGRVWGFLGSR
jgi:RHS repeat-associated protein